MPKIINPETMEYGLGPFNRPPFGLLTVIPNLCTQANAERLVFDKRMLPPGEYSFPYHYHRNAEEVMLVISGSMTIRFAEGFRVVNAGEVLFFETGESGAHQFYNHTDKPCAYFDVKTLSDLDVVVYPDSGKVMISRYNEVYDLKNGQVDYFRDEDDVAAKWKRHDGP